MERIRCFDCTGVTDCDTVECDSLAHFKHCPLCGSTKITTEEAVNDCEEENDDE